MSERMPEFMRDPAFKIFFDRVERKMRDGAPAKLKEAFEEWEREGDERRKLEEEDARAFKDAFRRGEWKMPDNAPEEFKKDFAQWIQMVEEREAAEQPLPT